MTTRRPIDRRVFVRSSMAGLGGLTLLGSVTGSQQENEVGSRGPAETGRRVVYRTLGNTGIRVPVVGMGMIHPASPNLIRAALDSGISHFDTTAFPGRQSRNEEVIAEALRDRPRDSYVIGTKVTSPKTHTTGRYAPAATGAAFTEQLDAHLSRLKTDHVDILYQHDVRCRESVSHEPIMEAMEKARKEGKTRFLGITTHMNMAEVVGAAVDLGFHEVVMTAYNFRQTGYLQVRDAIAKAAGAGLGVVVIKLIRGMSGVDPEVNASACLKWALADPNVHATIPGFNSFDEMNEDLAVMEDMALTDSEEEYLKKATTVTGLYCEGCGRCIEQCPRGLPIPDVMRAYMYCLGYRSATLSKSLIDSLNLPRDSCESCSECVVTCNQRFDIPSKVRSIVRIRDVPPEFLV